MAKQSVTAASSSGTSGAGGTTVAKVFGAPADAIESLPRWNLPNVHNLSSGFCSFGFFTAPFSLTAATKLGVLSATNASSGLTLARIGLFTVAPDDALTLVARTASDTTLLNAADTYYERALSTTGGYPASYDLVEGSRYAIGFIAVGTTPGSLRGVDNNAAGFLSPKLGARSAAELADLPTTLAAASMSSDANYLNWGRVGK